MYRIYKWYKPYNYGAISPRTSGTAPHKNISNFPMIKSLGVIP